MFREYLVFDVKKKKRKKSDPSGVRTRDPRIKGAVLYQLS